MIEFHEPVMVSEVMRHLLSRPREVVVDCTVGDGGHSLEVLSRTKGTFVVGVDVDSEAVAVSRMRLGESFPGRFVVTKGDYRELPTVLAKLGIPAIDGALYDLGVSSRQLDAPERGFSYWGEGPLDMRMDRESAFTAREILNTWSEEEIGRILRDYGEERFSARISREIVRAREEGPLETAKDLVAVIKRAVPGPARRGATHPARRTFQALRIAANDELSRLGTSLERAFGLLRPGGAMAVLSYHSLEDRIVKSVVKSLADRGLVKKLTRRPETASEAEVSRNARSRSAKLRAIEKVP
jgi:16S rRNA (cytosine1402-N4)-methyltransferase